MERVFEQRLLAGLVLVLGAQAVKRAHFFTQPVFVPFIYLNDALCVPSGPSAQIGQCQPGRLSPQTTNFVEFAGHN